MENRLRESVNSVRRKPCSIPLASSRRGATSESCQDKRATGKIDNGAGNGTAGHAICGFFRDAAAQGASA